MLPPRCPGMDPPVDVPNAPARGTLPRKGRRASAPSPRRCPSRGTRHRAREPGQTLPQRVRA
eukprot:7266793-Lingulodinium_polyedra.AAC.1